MELIAKIIIWLVLIGMALSALGIILQIVLFGGIGIGVMLYKIACVVRRNWIVWVSLAVLALLGVAVWRWKIEYDLSQVQKIYVYCDEDGDTFDVPEHKLVQFLEDANRQRAVVRRVKQGEEVKPIRQSHARSYKLSSGEIVVVPAKEQAEFLSEIKEKGITAKEL